MNKIWILTKRNLIHYYRDKGALFFSFLSVFIVIGVYIFFLADMQINNLQSELGKSKNISYLVYTWIIGGLLCIPAVSVPIILLTFKVNDTIEGIQDDFFVTPVKRCSIMLGYVLSAWIAGIIMTIFTLVLGELFILIKGGQLLSIIDLIKMIGIISILIFSFCGFSFFIIIHLKSNSSITIVNTILNTLIGFLTCLYFPIGYLSDGISMVIKIFPLSHATSLLRKIIMEYSMNQLFSNTSEYSMNKLKQDYGIDLIIGKHILSTTEMIFSLIIFGIIFYIASIVVLKRYKKINNMG
ncbi:MAG: ABC transporter permease [Clostridiales bacterium]